MKFEAQLKDEIKGYWRIYGTSHNQIHIHYSPSIPLKKESAHYYFAEFLIVNDTLKLKFVQDHVLPGFEYALLKNDKLYLKIKQHPDQIILKVNYVKQ